MDAKKAYRGAKAALRTAEQIKQELKGRNLALAYGARPSLKEAQAAQEYVAELEQRLSIAEADVTCRQAELDRLRLENDELLCDLFSREDEVDELEAEVLSVHQRLRAAQVIGISACLGFIGHLLYWHWDEFPSFW